MLGYRTFPLFLFVVAFFSLFAFAAQTAQTTEKPPYEKIPGPLLAGFFTLGGGKNSIEYYLADVLKGIRDFAENSNTLQASDIDIMKARIRASLVSRQIQAVMQTDLDFDGKVTRREVEDFASKPNNTQFGNGMLPSARLYGESLSHVEKMMTLDKNKDDVITIDEMRTLPAVDDIYKLEQGGLSRQLEKLQNLLALDPDKDGKLTIAELDKLARDAFAIVDLDHNAILSMEELSALRLAQDKRVTARPYSGTTHNTSSIPATPPAPPPVPSAPPALTRTYYGNLTAAQKPTSTDKVFFVSAHLGGIYSDVDIGVVTRSARINIEDGKEPIYLVIASENPIIWQIAGSTARIKRVLLVSATTGVVGIEKDKVIYSPIDGILYGEGAFRSSRSWNEHNNSMLQDALGRLPDASFGESIFREIDLPTGTLKKLDAGQLKLMREGFDPLSPDDVAVINVNTLVANAAAKKYVVLPAQAGIAQLVAEKKIEKVAFRSYKIIAPFYNFPIGLEEGLSVKFVLGKNIPMPTGGLGHSCVYSEETGKLLTSFTEYCK